MLSESPGLLFVVATLIPLASFVILLLAGAKRAYLRQHKDNPTCKFFFELLGGEVTGRGPAYVALGAIALSCVLCVIGFVTYLSDTSHVHHERAALEEKIADKAKERDAEKDIEAKAKLKSEIKKLERELAAGDKEYGERWSGSVVWASVQPRASADPDQATTLRVGYRIDFLSAVMFVMVTFIATLIHLFSMGYMDEELHKVVEDHEVHTEHGHYHRKGRYGRFFLFLSLFCFSMLNLILADNLFQVFVSWELVGVCSYLLIGFYFERTSASNAANKAFITNRVGDAGFIIGLLIVWTYVGSFNFQEIFGRVRAPSVDSHRDAVELGDKFVRITPTTDAPAGMHVAFEGKSLEAMEVPREKDGERFYFDDHGSHILLIPRNYLKPTGHFHAPEFDPHYHVVTDEALAELKKHKVPEATLQKLAKLKDENPLRDAKFLDKLKAQFPKGTDFKKAVPELDEILEATALPATTPIAKEPGANDNGAMPYWLLVVAGLGIFLGCVGKSAQFPLQVWLPDAMEGPTPVSALIHAATMVAAGVYLVGRCFPLFTAEVLLTIAYTGAITLFVAATTAVVMTDIKKVLAYSTVSQLGYMMLGLGVGGWVAGLFHLITHAFFKALMFLASGSVIYGCHHVQEMGRMGGLYKKMKITALTMLVGCLAIAGIPLFSGWYSKDAILASAFGFASIHGQHFLLFLLPLLTAGLTTFYMFRMWFMTFAGKPKDPHVYEHAHETAWPMTVPLIVLAFFSVVVAWGWPMWDAEASWLGHQLEHAQPSSVEADFGPSGHSHGGRHLAADDDHDHMSGHEHGKGNAAAPDHGHKAATKTVLTEAHAGHSLAGNLALVMVAIGLSFAVVIYYLGVLDPADAKEQFPGVHRFLAHKWYFDELYSAILVRPALAVAGWARSFDLNVIDGFVHLVARIGVWASWVHGLFDKYVIDGIANLIATVSQGVGNWFRGLQTGYLRSYVLFLVVAAVSIWVFLSFLFGTPAAGTP